MLTKILLVFIGGGAGSAFRYLLGQFFGKSGSVSQFPWATLWANLLACLVFALTFYALKGKLNTTQGVLITTGFCGGLSTMSTFSFEFMRLVANQAYFVSFVYFFISIILCFSMFLLIFNHLKMSF